MNDTKNCSTFIIDSNLVFSLPNGGVDFMVAAASRNFPAFKACIEDGWRKHLGSSYVAGDFVSGLVNIRDPDRAKEVFKLFFSDATKDEIQEVLFSRAYNPPIRDWFGLHDWEEKADTRRALFEEVVKSEISMDGEFSFSSPGKATAKHTLLSSFVSEATMVISISDTRDVQFPFLVRGCGKGIKELFDLGIKLDRTTAACILRMEKQEHVTEWMKAFSERGLLNAAELLKSVSRLKIPKENLAYLQSKAAQEAIEGVLAGPGASSGRGDGP